MLPIRPLRRFFPLACIASLFFAAAHTHADVRLNGSAIEFEGRIDAASAARAIELLRDPAVTRIVITSRGGLVVPALDLAEAMLDRGIDIEVPVMCLSSCANYLFPAARRKSLGHPLAVGWHGNMAHVLHLRSTGEGAQWTEGEMAQAAELAAREDVFYRRANVDGNIAWFGKLPPYSVAEFYTLAPADMARFGMRDVMLRETGSRLPGGESVTLLNLAAGVLPP